MIYRSILSVHNPYFSVKKIMVDGGVEYLFQKKERNSSQNSDYSFLGISQLD